jgi:hypothetical protein
VPANRSVLKAALAAVLLALPAALWLGGCSSDEANSVGSGLVDPVLTDVLHTVSVTAISDYGTVQVQDAAVPVHRQQVLYLGSQNGVGSRILVNYDFGNVYTDEYPESMFTAGNIKAVKLSLTKLSHYGGLRRVIDNGDTTYVASGQPLDLYYVVQQASAPFDSTAYVGYPGAAPAVVGPAINSDFLDVNQSIEPVLRLYEQDLLDWLDAGQKVGLAISLGPNSDDGLIGFAARELLRYSELDNVAVGTVVAPNLIVEFEDNTILNFLLKPVDDTSTFEQVAALPADRAALDDPAARMVLRTCLRSYPMFDFDFATANLPKDILINRAVLRLTNDVDSDTSPGFGNSEAIVLAEIDSTRIADAPLTMTPTELGAASYVITGQTSLDPSSARHLSFDVTALVQRLVNNVYTSPRGIVLAPGEDVFPTYDIVAVDPDFYFDEFRFFGPAAADSVRPTLVITYSRHEERMGGAK